MPVPRPSPAPAGSGELPDAVFTARGVTRVYRSGSVEVHALRGVDLTLVRGELVVLLGPSGSGKSTLLNILGGLDVPTGGEIDYCGERLDRMDERALTRFRRAHVGFVFQFYNLLPNLTALENVALVAALGPAPLSAETVLGDVGLAERLHHYPAQLSGGEQQRVAIARALAKRPDVLLCDEPTGALDAATGVQVLAAIEAANRTYGTTTVVITHNADIARFADRVLLLGDGRIVREQRNVHRTPARELSW